MWLVGPRSATSFPRRSVQAALGIGSSADDLRTGWYPTQPNARARERLRPGLRTAVPVTPLDGQIYAQPLLANGVLLVVTETNHLYTLDP